MAIKYGVIFCRKFFVSFRWSQDEALLESLSFLAKSVEGSGLEIASLLVESWIRLFPGPVWTANCDWYEWGMQGLGCPYYWGCVSPKEPYLLEMIYPRIFKVTHLRWLSDLFGVKWPWIDGWKGHFEEPGPQ